MTRAATQQRGEGFTLVELLAAMSVLVLLSVGLGASMVAGMGLNGTIRERDVAREAARSQMERVLAWGDFDTVVEEFNGSTFVAGDLAPLAGNPAAGQIVINADNPELFGVTVRVDWSGRGGVEELELRTEIANLVQE